MIMTSASKPTSLIGIPTPLSSKTYGPQNKLGVGVLEHCIAAGEVARELIQKVLPSSVRSWLGSELLSIFPFVVSCHDIGKISGFQFMLRRMTIPYNDPAYPIDPTYGTLRHEVVSYEFLRKKFSEFLASIILYHHGYYRNGSYSTQYGSPVDPAWELERTNLFIRLANYFCCNGSATYSTYTANITKQKYLTGLLVVSDYIASDETFFPPSGYTVESIPRRVSKALAYYDFYSKGADSISGKFTFEDIFKFKPNEAQSEMISIVDGPGIYIYEDVMSGGKTEGALYPAMNLYSKGIVDGIYFGMPSQITSNRMFYRVKKALDTLVGESNTVRLIHSNADMLHDPRQDDWYKGNKRAILDEFGVGTADQMLMGVLPNIRHFFLRTFGLYRKAVILDEVHSYDVYTSGLIKTLIKDLVEMDCVVIILSATLTEATKKELLNAI